MQAGSLSCANLAVFPAKAFKIALVILILGIGALRPVDALALSFDGLSRFWLGLTNPLTTLAFSSVQTPVPLADRITYANVPAMQVLAANGQAPAISPHENAIISFLTFGNKASLRNLNVAYFLGTDCYPYVIFTHDGSTSYYLAKHLDASAVLFYAYSWFINIPGRVFGLIDNIIEVSSVDGVQMTTSAKWLWAVNVVLSLLSLCVEIPLMVINTIVGCCVGLIFHPWDSVCSFLGCFYFGALTTINAIWEGCYNLVMIPYDLFFG